MPIKLYRFQPEPIECNAARLDNLKPNKIYVSDPKSFNDPFDLNIKVNDLTDRWNSGEAFQEAIKKAFEVLVADKNTLEKTKLFNTNLIAALRDWMDGYMEDKLDGVASAIQLRLSELGIACLTQDYKNRLLWAHYSNMGKGFCIEYEVMPINNMPNLRYVPVQYVSVLPELCVTEALFSPHQFLYKYAATKHLDWAYEREVRLVSLSGKGQEIDIHPGFLRINGLIAGYQMSDSVRKHLIETAKRLNINAFQLKSDLSRETSLLRLFTRS